MSHYAILDMEERQHDPSLTQQDVKQAYKRALLLHHPDKERRTESHTAVRDARASQEAVSIDAIAIAFKTLSDPSLRAEYDRELRLSQKKEGNSGQQKSYHTGLDTVDLDDLAYHETTSTWTRACRCGQKAGFVVSEEELEKHADLGELVTGCRGCSLWLRVLFGVEGL